MKTILNSKMTQINGGAKCIYHAMIAVGTIGLGPISWFINYKSGNYNSVYQCWNNNHSE